MSTKRVPDAPWVVGITLDRGWPCYRLRDMDDPRGQMQAVRLLIEAAPKMEGALRELCDCWATKTLRDKELRAKALRSARAILAEIDGKTIE